MPKIIYLIMPFEMNTVKIGKTIQYIQDLRHHYTRSYGSNMCIHYFQVDDLDLDRLETFIHNMLKQYKTIGSIDKNELYMPEHYSSYLDQISQITKRLPVHYECNDDFMFWLPN